ncbi:transposase, partial [Actinacidiphila oryziradicis]|uniref:transposase n=1 Tax=Actinacidiphila oryziradicis TaxID=2571141 RepID=UPI0023F1EDD8
RFCIDRSPLKLDLEVHAATSKTLSTPRTSRSGNHNAAELKITMESVNARIRKAVRARGHFPNEAAALKCVYMALMSLDPTGKGRKRWTMRWKAPLNAFQIAFEGRLTPANN